ncbi:MAG TPA: hypothetical protein DCX54_04335 [Flavobacteriales bacterium]|nr:hypothetical protein [Flavobacteriales bacterium]
MKNISWLRKFQLPLNLTVLIFLFLFMFQKYVLNVNSTFYFEGEKKIALGISVVQQDASVFSEDTQNFYQENSRTTSFLLQPQSSFAQIYLDYITVYDDAGVPKELSISSIYTSTNSDLVPSDLILEKSITNLNYDANEYEYIFDSQNMVRGKRYLQPHILLGIVPIESSANIFNIYRTTGNRPDLFPFDEQRLDIKVSFDGVFDGEPVTRFSPLLEVVVAQKGWTGSFEKNTTGNTNLHLIRYSFYQIVLIIFLLVMIPITLLLNNVMQEGFFEVAFGLLLGLWGMHEILVPVYVQSSALIDFIIYILYVLVIGEILFELLKGLFIRHGVKVRIKDINPTDEYVVLENKGWVKVDMTKWTLFDSAGNSFTFPSYILKREATVKIWTRIGTDTQTNLFWNRKSMVWNDNGDTAYLKDEKDIVIDVYSYPE